MNRGNAFPSNRSPSRRGRGRGRAFDMQRDFVLALDEAAPSWRGRGGNRPNRGRGHQPPNPRPPQQQYMQPVEEQAVNVVAKKGKNRRAFKPKKEENKEVEVEKKEQPKVDFSKKIELTSVLKLPVKATVRPDGFHFTFIGLIFVMKDWLIPHYIKYAGTEFRDWINTAGNRTFFIRMMLHFCEVKILYAYSKPVDKSARYIIPTLNLTNMFSLASQCTSLPRLMADMIRHLGKVTFDDQTLMPAYSEDRLFSIRSFVPSRMTAALLSYYQANDIPDFEQYRYAQLNDVFPDAFAGRRIRNMQALLNPQPTVAQLKSWMEMIETIRPYDSGIFADLETGEGELGQLICASNYPDPRTLSHFFSQFYIPEGSMAAGVIYGVGLVSEFQDRHVGLGIDQACWMISASQNVLRASQYK